MSLKQYYVYMMANSLNGVLYIGSTNNIQRRAYQHKYQLLEGFSQKYKTTKLVYLEEAELAYQMVSRERQLKGWTRKKKEHLVNTSNPEWQDLYDQL